MRQEQGLKLIKSKSLVDCKRRVGCASVQAQTCTHRQPSVLVDFQWLVGMQTRAKESSHMVIFILRFHATAFSTLVSFHYYMACV